MKYLSTFSGIEAATVAWHPLGWEPVGFSEIEPFPSAVLSHHYKQIKNYGDITKFEEWAIEPFQLLVGGSPCQSFSVAGLRKGLADPRGNLMLTYLAVAEKHKPQWIVWENVPGVLSSNGGRDFGTFLGALGEIGYGYAYRVLDAQFFGVAQRRRRVFVVGYLGDWRPAAAVLFEPDSLSGTPPPSREKGKGTAGCFADGTPTTCPTIGTELAKQVNNQMVANAEAFYHVHPAPHAFKMRGGCEGGGKGYLGQDECAFTLSTLQDQQIAQPISIQGNLVGREKGGPHGVGANEDGTMYTLTKGDVHAVAQPFTYDMSQVTSPQNKQNRVSEDPCHTLAKDNANNAVVLQPIPIDSMNHLGRGENHSMGDFIEGAPSYTITKGHHHAVAQPITIASKQQSQNIGDDIANPICVNDYKEPQVVAQPIAFQSVDDGSDASEEISGTLRSHDPMAVAQPIVLDDQGGSVMRVNQDGIVGTLRRETHGHEPIVAQPMAFDWQSGGDSRGLDPKDMAQLQRCQVPAVMQPKAYAFDSLSSNSMKSSNPISGCNEVEISKTLDTTDPNPSKNQGGMAVVQPIGFHATRRDGGRLVEDVMPTVEANWGTGGGNVPTITQPTYCLAGQHPNKNIDHELSGTLPAAMGMGGGHTPLINDNIQYAVRRLTPIECERLQGFPDNYTAIPWKKKDASECPDGPRYKALGNSMAVPVMRWIGERIQYVENLMKELNK